jgi:hypothetical protein
VEWEAMSTPTPPRLVFRLFALISSSDRLPYLLRAGQSGTAAKTCPWWYAMLQTDRFLHVVLYRAFDRRSDLSRGDSRTAQ